MSTITRVFSENIQGAVFQHDPSGRDKFYMSKKNKEIYFKKQYFLCQFRQYFLEHSFSARENR